MLVYYHSTNYIISFDRWRNIILKSNKKLEFGLNNRVPVVFITDENFAIPTCVAIISLIENKDKDTFYDIFIFVDRISIGSENKLLSLKKDDVNIQLIHISSEKFEGIHEQGEKSICVASLSALFKFEIPNILPLEDKILYLDGDILVRKDLKELFNINIENFYVAAAHDTGKIYYKRPIIKKIPSYFNSGVMLLNLKRLRENKIPESLIETKKRQKTNLMDQDVFNIVLQSGVKHIDIKYNFLILNLLRAKDKYKFEQINALFNSSYKDLEDVEEKSHIIHFSSQDKPWKYVDGVYSKQWFSYFRMSPFRDSPNISDIELAINEYSRECPDLRKFNTNPKVHHAPDEKKEGIFQNHHAELDMLQNKIKKLKNQIKNFEGEVDKKNREIDALKWTMETHNQLIDNFKAESRSIKQIYLKKNVSFSPDYGKLTVIIPYRRTDDLQREENLDINLNYLSKLGIKNLIISQHSDKSAKPLLIEKYGNLFDYFRVYFSYADGKLFNKSLAINQGVIKSKTPYIAIFDVDALTRKENIDQAIYLLDKGFELVHPFDRLVKDIVDKKSFIADWDFEKVKSPTQQRDWADGGIVFWNKRSFIDIGMKNEHITGWGSEDNEIIFRANIFQLKQIRIDDILYHLFHDRLKVKTRDNFENMKKMMYIKSKKELLKEINQWTWLEEAKKTIQEDHALTTDIYKKKKFDKLLSFLYILKKEKLNPKNIYRIFKSRGQIKSLNLFDEKYYLIKYPHLINSNIELLNHYLYHGWKEERTPSRKFDGNYYLKRYPDVRKSKTNPLVHYVLHGKKEGRFPNHHAESNSPQNI